MQPIPNSYTVSPSRLVAGEYPGSARYTLPADAESKLVALLDAGISVFIDLTEANELEPYAELVTQLGTARGMTIIHERHPIRDVSITSPERMTAILDSIDAHHAAGRTVYVHCWGGIGRTGMTIGCWLVRHGATPEDALATVDEGFSSMPKRARMGDRRSPESREQVEVVRGWRG
jgi:protein-tyrosine phosphatase